MLDSDFAAETRAMLANELRLGKLRELMRREYAEVHRQEMRRQRPAITAWAEYWDERRERAIVNSELSENAYNCPRHERR